MINFNRVILLYAPVFLLCISHFLKDRYRFKGIRKGAQHCSLIPAIVIIALLLSNYLVQSFWYKTPILGYSYNQAGWELIVLIWNFLVFIIIFFLLNYFNLSLVNLFNFQKDYLYDVLKIGFILTAVIVLLSQLLGVTIIHDLSKEDLLLFKSMSPIHIVLFCFNTLILIPIVEEIIFRGLLYAPLYQKIGRNGALFLTSYVFLHSHFGIMLESIFESIVIFFTGYLLTWLYDRKKTLIYPIGYHMLFNFWFVYFQLFSIFD